LPCRGQKEFLQNEGRHDRAPTERGLCWRDESDRLADEDNGRLFDRSAGRTPPLHPVRFHQDFRAGPALLEERLARLLPAIPIAVQREGLSLPALQTSLRGRWRGNCHPGELGTALRKLGFKRERRWHSDGGFRAVWRKEG